MMTSLYIHIPFCAHKCPYCSFPVVAGQLHREADYLAALAREAGRCGRPRVGTFYVGGGTPTALSDKGLACLVRIVTENFVIDDGERTLEANPEDITATKAALARSLGFTRVSFGAQSFLPKYLAYLGRRHEAGDAFSVFALLRSAGFDNINVDIMFGFPGQSMDELDADIDAVLSLKSEHVSLYALTVEDRSVFRVRGEKVADEEQAVFYRHVCRRLDEAGLEQYEVSNFARPGYSSAHNMNYWQGGDYVGLGMGAHSHFDGVRSWNADTFPTYLQMVRDTGSAVVGREKLAPPEKMMEMFLFGLRMNAGVDLAEVERRYGSVLAPEKIDELEGLISAGFLAEEQGRIRATDQGRLVLDEISARLI